MLLQSGATAQTDSYPDPGGKEGSVERTNYNKLAEKKY